MVYKGLFTATQTADFYWDLRNPLYKTRFGIFHQRFSTNTSSTWDKAQPFRMLAHNGEINTIQSNFSWMRAREVDASSSFWKEDIDKIKPFIDEGISDSGQLDNAIELLVRSGRTLAHSQEMLIPSAWENNPRFTQKEKAFYQYHAFLTEPWGWTCSNCSVRRKRHNCWSRQEWIKTIKMDDFRQICSRSF